MFKRFHWGHGIIAALASFIIFILGMIFLFPIGKQNAEMVSDNYYEEELVYQNVIDAKNRADGLAEKPEYSQDKGGITIRFPESINNSNSKFSFNLFRTDDRRYDVNAKIKLDKNNSVYLPAKILKPGSYTLKMLWTKDALDYQIDYDVLWMPR
ncbi:FixH family protein [Cruoricaptor ignavus]|uniref:FixH family protein n=1 Tax=Cruoricaptor ignavus TaxID=1118202 RepID=A0A7M1SZV4_9FLAO|nr:FixH family protein [Cruoricaptor ignavus]QOR73041.1 FixH family protein [Cruoricaptor ignavus]